MNLSSWNPEDIVTTNFRTVVQAAQENYDQGWQEAIDMVLDVLGLMYDDYDQETLEELKQRIV